MADSARVSVIEFSNRDSGYKKERNRELGIAPQESSNEPCEFFCLPAVRSREGQGSPPLVRTADAPAIHAVTAPPRRIRPADASLSLGCGTRCTADADGSARPGSPRPVRSTRVGTTADGLPRWPDGRTARTTASCRGRPCGCAASVCRRQRRHVTHGPRWPRAHARCSVRRLGSEDHEVDLSAAHLSRGDRSSHLPQCLPEGVGNQFAANRGK